MRSLHTNRDVSAFQLRAVGKLVHVKENLYRWEIPAKDDEGPIGSYWLDVDNEIKESEVKP